MNIQGVGSLFRGEKRIVRGGVCQRSGSQARNTWGDLVAVIRLASVALTASVLVMEDAALGGNRQIFPHSQ